MPMTAITRATRSPRVTAFGVVGFAAALAVASQVAVPVPGTPVPATLQPLVVVLAGFWLGPIAGAASMLLYLVLGAAGLPVFAPMGAPGIARFVGPTGGYLMAYPAAAFVAGWLGGRSTSFVARVLAAWIAIAVLLLGGIAHLAVINRSTAAALAFGLHPFVPLDLVKAALAALLAPKRAPRTPV
jgi:biotin transport system substrate-specific component